MAKRRATDLEGAIEEFCGCWTWVVLPLAALSSRYDNWHGYLTRHTRDRNVKSRAAVPVRESKLGAVPHSLMLARLVGEGRHESGLRGGLRPPTLCAGWHPVPVNWGQKASSPGRRRPMLEIAHGEFV